MALYAYAQNYLTSTDVIVPSSMVGVQNPPFIERFAAGSARVELQGTYTDAESRNYVVLVSFANEGAASWKYDWSDTGEKTWNAINVTVVPNVFQNLSHGLQVRFVAGAFSPQLVYGDKFRFHIERPYKAGYAIDGSRETEMRTGALTAGNTPTVAFPFSLARSPKALILFDHTILSSTVIRLQASTVSNFASTPYNQIVPWAAGKIRFPITGSPLFQYWRLHFTIADASAGMGWTGLYLGDEIAFTEEFDHGFRKTLSLMGGSDSSILARGRGRYGLQPHRYELTFGYRKAADDLSKLQTLWDLTHPQPPESQKPFYLYFDSVPTLPIFEYFHIEGDMPQSHNFNERMTPVLNLLQLVRTAAA